MQAAGIEHGTRQNSLIVCYLCSRPFLLLVYREINRKAGKVTGLVIINTGTYSMYSITRAC